MTRGCNACGGAGGANRGLGSGPLRLAAEAKVDRLKKSLHICGGKLFPDCDQRAGKPPLVLTVQTCMWASSSFVGRRILLCKMCICDVINSCAQAFFLQDGDFLLAASDLS